MIKYSTYKTPNTLSWPIVYPQKPAAIVYGTISGMGYFKHQVIIRCPCERGYYCF